MDGIVAKKMLKVKLKLKQRYLGCEIVVGFYGLVQWEEYC